VDFDQAKGTAFMKRYFIKVGDKTTAGGVVTQGEPTATHHGTPYAYHGAEIYCHACKSVGRVANVPPFRPMTLRGKQIALENDICICKCKPPPRLIASQRGSGMLFEAYELPAIGYGPDGRALPNEQISTVSVYDERFTLTDGNGKSLPDTNYTVRLPSDELRRGTTDSSGRTGRYETNGARSISIHLGHNQEA
jgi:uncharacterized Zn-binding protein involved in type VI secretion